MFDVIGIGSPAVDYFFKTDRKYLSELNLKPEDDYLFSQKNINPKEIFKNLELITKSAGGISSNTLAVLAQLGLKTSYFGTVGIDDEGKRWLRMLNKVDMSHTLRKGKMSYCVCLLTTGGKYRTFLSQVNPYENDFLKKSDMKYLNGTRYMHIGPLIKNPQIGLKETIKLLKVVKTPKISFSPSIHYTQFGYKKLLPILKKTEIIFLNQKEMKYLMNMGVKSGSRKLIKTGPRIVICTMAEEGSIITSQEGQFEYSRVNTPNLLDTTGAGDAYAAGFLYGLIKGKSLQWSARNASIIASKSISDFGLNWLGKNGLRV